MRQKYGEKNGNRMRKIIEGRMKKIGFVLTILFMMLYSAGCGKQPSAALSGSEGDSQSTLSDIKSQEVYRDHIRYILEPEGLTVIDYTGEEAEVIIPSAVDEIPVVRIDDMAFKNDTFLKKIVLAEGINEIGKMAFANCEGLELIEIPASVTMIEGGVFAGCTSLKEIFISEANSSYRFDGSSLLGREGALLHSYISGGGETSYTVPEGVTEIGSYSFALCEGLLSIELLEGVEEIGDSAFFMCESLKTVNFPSGLTAIGDNAFLFCESLEQAVIPETVIRIGSEAFGGCGQLKDFRIAEGNEAYVFEDGVLFSRDKTRLCAYMQTNPRETYDVPESVTEIGEKAFSNCGLKAVKLPKRLTKIGDGAFENCFSLNKVELPDGVTDIGKNAFSSCAAMEKIVIPDGVTELRAGTFSGCISLKNIVIPDSVTSFGEGVFGSSRLGTLPQSYELVLTVGENSAALKYAREAEIAVEIR